MTMHDCGFVEMADPGPDPIAEEVALASGRVGMMLTSRCLLCGNRLASVDIDIHVAFHVRIGDVPAVEPDTPV